MIYRFQQTHRLIPVGLFFFLSYIIYQNYKGEIPNEIYMENRRNGFNS